MGRPSVRAGALLVGGWLVGRAAVDRLRRRSLRGHVAIVTGASRGLGLLLAHELGRAGCRVAIWGRDPDRLETARRSLAAEGVDALAVPCDVGDRGAVERAVHEVESHFGPIDLLVNNASIMQVGALPTLTVEDFEAAMQANFWGTVYPTLAVLPTMRLRGSGRIVNVTSIGGRISAPHLLPYGAAKFAATGFSEGLRAELARDGIAVTTVVPWFMRTGSHLRATFKPPRDREFAWFALGASLPLVSIAPERAARQIVAAVRRGDADRSVGILSVAAWRFHGLFPGLTATLFGILNRFLPRAPVAVGPGVPSVPSAPGEVAERELDSRLHEVVTALGRRSADRLNQRTAPGT